MNFNFSRSLKKTIKNELNSNDGIKDGSFTYNLPPTKKEIELLEAFIGNKLSPQIIEFYNESSGLDFRWEYQNPNTFIVTSASGMPLSLLSLVYGLHYAFDSSKRKIGKRHENYLWSKNSDPDYIDYVENNYCIMDKIDLFNYTYTLVKFIDEKTEPELFLYKYPDYICPLTLSYTEYFEAAYQCRMIEGWQDYFIDKKRCDNKTVEYLEKERSFPSLSKLYEIFLDLDTTLFPEITSEDPLSYENLAIEKKYYQRFQNSFSQLENTIKVNTGKFTLNQKNKPLTIHIIRKIESILGRRLPDSMLAFYCQLNGCRLMWSLDKFEKYGEKPDYLPSGEFSILGLEQVFGGERAYDKRDWTDRMWDEVLTIEDALDEEEMNFAKQCRPIIIEPYTTTLIRFVEGQEEPEIWIFYKAKFHQLPITFEELMENIIVHMSIEDWQLFLTDGKSLSDDFLESRAPVIQFIRDVFPETDLSKYRKIKSRYEID